MQDNWESQPEQTLRLHLSRADPGHPWGFRLQGGVDFNTPLSVQLVQPNSVAERCGLRAGDGILTINNANTDSLSHEQAKMEIIRSNNDIYMVVQRGAVNVWKPKVTPISQLRPNELRQVETATGEQVQTAQKTSLEKSTPDQISTIGGGYNRSARGFNPGPPSRQQSTGSRQAVPTVVHAQFNTPIGLYSADNIASTYSTQTEGIQRQMSDLDVEDAPVGMKMTGTYQVLDEKQKQQSPGGDETLDDNTSNSHVDQADASERLKDNPSPPDVSLPPESTNEHDDDSVVTNGSTQYGSPVSSPVSAGVPGGGLGGPAGFRAVKAPTTVPINTQSPKMESMHCAGCGNLVTGVFVRVKGQPYHDKCFKCANCGLFLKQKGYFMIDGQLYCEVHARRAAQPPSESSRYAGAVYR